MSQLKELDRLATYSSWDYGINPMSLARSGFVHTGPGDTTTCINCQTKISGWVSGDDPKQKHPNCSFSPANTEVADIINKVRLLLGSEESISSETRGKDRIDNFDDKSSLQNGASKSEVQSDTAFKQICSNILRRGGSKDFSILFVSVPSQTDSASNIRHLDRQNPDFDRLRSERLRLDTFYDWPETAARIVNTFDLAKAGLFYTGQHDRVQCAFCRGFLRNWVRGDTPNGEHQKHFPDCPFVRGREVGNFDTIDAVQRDLYLSLPGSARIDGHQQTNVPPPSSFHATNVDPGRNRRLTVRRPKYPNFANERKRVESFAGGIIPRGQSAISLAKAGFFHVGPNDNVKCFYCDGGLKNWREDDDPWTEHTRWFPQCPLVQQHNDQSFSVQTLRESLPSNANHSQQNNGEPYRFEPREIKARLDSELVKSVLALGFQRELVKQVIERRLTATGDDFPNVVALVEAVIQLQEQQNLSSSASSQPTPNPRGAAASHQSQNSSVSSNTLNEMRSMPPPAANRELLDATQQAHNSMETTAEMFDENAQKLMEENRQLKEAKTCRICWDKEINTVFLPCGHLVCCDTCSSSLSNCPICRAFIRGSVRTFLS